MNIQEGKSYYFYDDRAVDNVCKAHVLHVLPHPEREEDRLIVYRWYGRHKQRWWYGVTTISQQEIWADYCKDAVMIAKERAKKRKEKRERADNDTFTHFLPKPVR
jgi:hypothetical protein